MEKTKTFELTGIKEKDFAKIFLHIQTHQKGIKVKESTEKVVRVEVKSKFIITYFRHPEERALVSTHKDNEKVLKEKLYHYMNCDCKIDKTINNTESFSDALKILGLRAK